MKATEVRLAALTPTPQNRVHVLELGGPVVSFTEVDKIRGDLYLAILELEERIK